MQQGDILYSDLLLGIRRDHSDDREAAEMTSTGNMLCDSADGSNPKSWFLEFKCDTCHQTVYHMSVDDIDLIRAVLMQNGII